MKERRKERKKERSRRCCFDARLENCGRRNGAALFRAVCGAISPKGKYLNTIAETGRQLSVVQGVEYSMEYEGVGTEYGDILSSRISRSGLLCVVVRSIGVYIEFDCCSKLVRSCVDNPRL